MARGVGEGAGPFLCIFEKEYDQQSLKRIFFIQFEKGDGLEEILDLVNHMGVILVRVIVFCINLSNYAVYLVKSHFSITSI